MAGMMPAIAMTSVDLLVHELDAASPVEHVSKASGLTQLPHTLDLFAPARLHDLVQIKADADVDVARDQGESSIPRQIESPRSDADVVNNRSAPRSFFNGFVRASGICNQDQIGILCRVAKSLDKVLFIFTYSINANFHFAAPSNTLMNTVPSSMASTSCARPARNRIGGSVGPRSTTRSSVRATIRPAATMVR